MVRTQWNEVIVTQLCLTLCNPMDYSPPGSSVNGILQARELEWAAIPFSRGSFWPSDQTQVSWITGRFLTIWATRELWLRHLNYWGPGSISDWGIKILQVEQHSQKKKSNIFYFVIYTLGKHITYYILIYPSFLLSLLLKKINMRKKSLKSPLSM